VSISPPLNGHFTMFLTVHYLKLWQYFTITPFSCLILSGNHTSSEKFLY